MITTRTRYSYNFPGKRDRHDVKVEYCFFDAGTVYLPIHTYWSEPFFKINKEVEKVTRRLRSNFWSGF